MVMVEYSSRPLISMTDLQDGRLAKYGITIRSRWEDRLGEERFWLVDMIGNNLEVIPNEQQMARWFVAYRTSGDPYFIMSSVRYAYRVTVGLERSHEGSWEPRLLYPPEPGENDYDQPPPVEPKPPTRPKALVD
jgi:hypothetical protein